MLLHIGNIHSKEKLQCKDSSGAVKTNNLAFCERSMKLSGFVLDDLSFNLRCGGILSLTPEVS